MEKILLVGDDIALLTSRAAVLASKKLEVVFCAARELATHSEGETFDLIVLCHSLSEDARGASVRTGRKRWPGVRVLQVLKHAYQTSSVESDADAVTTADPGLLVENVMKLLGESHGSSKSRGFVLHRTFTPPKRT
jgi:hypothetical protein